MMEVNITVRCASVCFLYQFVVVELVLGLNWAGLDVNVERKYLFCAESTQENYQHRTYIEIRRQIIPILEFANCTFSAFLY